jgi:PleD family two-component response regulator
VLPGASAEAASVLSERLCAGVREAGWVDLPAACGVTVRIGVATSVPDEDGPRSDDRAAAAVADLLARADAALYAAKAKGRDRVELDAPPSVDLV